MASLVRVLVLAGLAACAFAGYPNAIPCPGDKGRQGKGVSCKEVKLPGNLCSACHLRPPAGNGNFKDCSNIYNTQNGACMAAMNEYVKHNQCDPMRKNAMDILNKNPNDGRARQDVDYFVYSVCEQCCDCIPMGASKADVGKWVPDRGNCPAHAWYDVCAILPQVTHFINVGQGTPGQFSGNPPSACKLLANWKNSGEFPNWQKKAKVNLLSGALNNALSSMVKSVSCSSKSVWEMCYDLESKQKNLGTPGTLPGGGNGGGGDKPKDGGGDKNCGVYCDGEVKEGCTIWDNNSKTCGGKGIKCFPKDGSRTFNCDGSGWQPGKDGGNGGGGDNGGDKPKDGGGDKNCGVACDGEVKEGCTIWDNDAKKCNGNGIKCYPKDGSRTFNCDGSGWQPGKDGGNQDQNQGGGGGDKSCAKCPGEVKFGCTNWDSTANKCTSQGKKCFPNNGSNLGYGCS